MAVSPFIETNGKRLLWRDLLQKRREQRQAARSWPEQPTLFALREDRRPATERRAADRYLQPSLFPLPPVFLALQARFWALLWAFTSLPSPTLLQQGSMANDLVNKQAFERAVNGVDFDIQSPEAVRKLWSFVAIYETAKLPKGVTTTPESILNALGGEPLAGSGFENGDEEPGFNPARQNPGPD